MRKIYLDDAASSRVYPGVLEAMKPFFLEEYGNPSSLHELGENATRVLNNARKKLASEINAKPEEIIFTSGATESNNIALRCVKNKQRKKIIISCIEHPSIEEVADYLERQGYRIARIPVNNNGLLDTTELEKELDSETLLVSVVHASNLIGVVQDLKAIGDLCKSKNVLLHTDACQSFGKLKIDVQKMNLDMLSASAHKIGGPKGTGFLYVKTDVKVSPLIFGGGQERGLRSGTENIPSIVGFSKALEICKETDDEKIKKIRDSMIAGLEKIGGKINSPRDERGLFNIVNVSFPGIDAETLVAFLSHKGIYVSAGSACDSKKEREEHVLRALGLSKKNIDGSIRITISENLSEKDVGFVVKEIGKSLKKLTM